MNDKSCITCKYSDVDSYDEPCLSCIAKKGLFPNYVKHIRFYAYCSNCKHEKVSIDDEPCCNCDTYEKWEDKTK